MKERKVVKSVKKLNSYNENATFQTKKKDEQATELNNVCKELIFQNEEKEKRAAELAKANQEQIYQHEEKEKLTISLNKAKRLYAFSSQLNQNIVQVKDESSLFKNACELAGQFGEFKIAWIGLFDPYKNTISLIEQIGISSDDLHYFSNVALKPNGPQEYLMRSGENFVCNDILNNKELESWQSQAIKQGVNSCMLLPIRKSGEVIGSFNLYAQEVDFFQNEEINLLLQVTNNMSFALDNFEKSKKQLGTEQLLAVSEKRFRLLIEKSTDMITLATRDGRLIYGSPFISTTLGYSTEELINMPLYEVVHPEDIPELLEKRNNLLRNPGKSFNFQHRRRHKNGSWIWCEGTFTNMLEEPGINAIVSNFRDISEKKKIEQQLEFEANNQNALINNTEALMWSVDKDFRLITSNEPFNQYLRLMFGHKITKGQSILPTIFEPEQLNAFKTLYERAFEGEAFTEIEHTIEPIEVWSEISYSPIFRGNEVIGAACHSRDITKKKLATQLAIDNEKRFRALIENSADAVVILSQEGKPFYVSPTVEKVLGYTEAEALNLDLFSLFHPDEVIWAVGVWQELLLKPGIPIPVRPSRMMHKDGNWRWLEGTLTNLLHEPAVNGIVDNFRDVTDKKLAEEALLLTQFSVEHAGDAVFWMTTDAQIIKVNEAACKMLGYSRDELVGLSVPDIDPFYDAEQWKIHYAELRQKGSLFFETVQQAKDGSLIPVEITANWIQFGDKELNCAFSRDISERKLIEKNLLDSKARLIEAQSLAHLGNFEVDLHDFSEVWSAEVYKILGIDKNLVSTQEAFFSFIHPEDLLNLKAALSAQKDTEIDYRFIRRDGTERFAHGILKFELDENQIAKRLYGTMQDITDRKLAETERTKMVNDLMRRNADLEQFAYIVSHNLRAPIANIMGAFVALNYENLPLDDKTLIHEGINSSIARLDEVVKDLNSILEVKNAINEVRETVCFSRLIEHIKLNIQNIIDKNEIEISYDFTELDEFFTLKAYLYSIFYNLISNSIKYRQPEGKCCIEIKSHFSKNKLELIFKDNSMGINLKKNAQKIFGLYNRFHFHAEGKGMGLFMVKTQVETLGGKINVMSEVNEGTEFKIEFDL